MPDRRFPASPKTYTRMSPYALYPFGGCPQTYPNFSFVFPTTNMTTHEGVDAQSHGCSIASSGRANTSRWRRNIVEHTSRMPLNNCPWQARGVESTNGKGMKSGASVSSTPTGIARLIILWPTSKRVYVQPAKVQTRTGAWYTRRRRSLSRSLRELPTVWHGPILCVTTCRLSANTYNRKLQA